MAKKKNRNKGLIVSFSILSTISIGISVFNLFEGREEQVESLQYQKIAGKEEYRVVGLGTISALDVVIPSTYRNLPVTEIGVGAFNSTGGTYLSSIEIPDSVTSIDEGAFESCTSLTSVKIPDSVTSIDEGAFAHCKSLTSVVIPDSVTSIGDYAFGDCSSLTSVVVPDSVTSIGSSAFRDCTSLTNVVIPDSVTEIGNDAFYNCDSLTSVVIGNSVTSIGYWAFDDCDSLTSVYYKGTAAEWAEISVGSGNYNLTNATWYYYSETEPTEAGNYWRYDENGEIVVW